MCQKLLQLTKYICVLLSKVCSSLCFQFSYRNLTIDLQFSEIPKFFNHILKFNNSYLPILNGFFNVYIRHFFQVFHFKRRKQNYLKCNNFTWRSPKNQRCIWKVLFCSHGFWQRESPFSCSCSEGKRLSLHTELALYKSLSRKNVAHIN